MERRVTSSPVESTRRLRGENKNLAELKTGSGLRYNLMVCREIQRETKNDSSKLTSWTPALARALRRSFTEHEVLPPETLRSASDSEIASQALIIIHECESTAGLREAMRTARTHDRVDSVN